MTIALVLYLMLAGTLLVLGARAADSALAIAGRSTRWPWTLALVGMTVMALVAPRSHSLRVNGVESTPAIAGATAAPVGSPDRSVADQLDAVRGMVARTAAGVIAAVNAHVPAAVAKPVALGWALASALLLVIYALVHLRLAVARRRWPVATMHGVPVRVAPRAGPAVIGMVRPEIVVPRSLLERSHEEQRLIVLHEHEHLRARDHVLLGLGCLVAIAIPWHPAVWYALARLRLAIELDCDARVLHRGAAPRSYGALLIDMAAQSAGIRVATLALADRPSHLERRLLAMKSNRSRFMLVRAGALCAVAGVLTLVACEARVPTSAELSAMDVAGAEKAVARTGAFSEASFDNADFFLNEKRVARAELLKLDGKDIGSMTVVKSRVAAGRDTVFLVTRDKMTAMDSLHAKEEQLRGAGTITLSDGRRMVPTPSLGPGRKPVITIDGKTSTEAALAALRNEDIVAVNIMKPDNGVAGNPYPNGLLAVKTKADAQVISKLRSARSDAPDPFAAVEVPPAAPRR